MMQNSTENYESLLLVSFGGPEKKEDVIPFLENVLAGKNVPRARLEEVAEHYYHFDGVSPINQQNRDLIRAIEDDFKRNGLNLPVYWGNRNWDPLLPDTIRKMAEAGVRRSLAFFTSAYSSYSGCRQYRENISDARESIGKSAPTIDKLRMFYNHPLFIDAIIARINEAWESVNESDRHQYRLVFTAHSIPESMASHCNYEKQLRETARLVSTKLECETWDLVYQSRSGPPQQPWLEPDIVDFLQAKMQAGEEHFMVVPIGFLSDHMEILFDLDVEANAACLAGKSKMLRAPTVGTHPLFIQMIRELVLERMGKTEKAFVGELPCPHDVCPSNCCLSGRPN